MVIVNYNIGNISSIANMLQKIGHKATVTNNPDTIANANKIILSGVGAFNNGMLQLSNLNLLEVLNEKVLHDKVPVLGICLGMQLMCKKSEEGTVPGLSWIDAEVIRFRNSDLFPDMRIPNIGWNDLKFEKKSKLFTDIDDPKFYFLHSYHLNINKSDSTSTSTIILSTSHYHYDFISAIEQDNILGVQFHPEKSHKYGMKLLKNFVELY